MSGPRTGWLRTSSALIAAVLACFALACSDDETDPAEQTGSAGGVNTPDASVRDLPGDGLEGTPDFDRNTTQREPIGPNALGEAIDEIDRGRINGEPVEDAGAPTPPPADAADAGAD